MSTDESDVGIKLLPGHRGEVNTCCLSPNHDIIVTGGDDGQLYVWKAETCLLLCNLFGHRGPVNCCAFSTCGRYLASGSYDATARIWDLATSKCSRILKSHSKSIEGICYSHDSKMITTTSWDKNVIVWSAATGIELHRFKGHSDCVCCCAFSYSGKKLATGGWDNNVIIWRTGGPKEIRNIRERDLPELGYNVLKGHTGKVSCVCFSRIEILASGSWDRTVKIWNMKRCRLIATFKGHTGWVKALAFTIDSVKLASVADDGSVRVWNIPRLQCIRQLKGKTDIAVMCNFNSNGELISSGTAKETHLKQIVQKEDDDTDVMENEDLE